MSSRVTDFYKQLDTQYAQGDMEQVERFLLQRAGETDTATLEGHGELIAICNELGSFYRGTSRYAQSLAAFERAEELVSMDYGDRCSQYATILNNMAGTYRMMRDFPAAITMFENAMDIYTELGEEHTYAFASVLNNLSLAYREAKETDKAIAYLEQALALIQRMPGRTQEVAVTYNNLTAMYYAQGNREKAMQCMRRALWEFEKCADEENVHYAAGLNSLAALLVSEEQCERALELYERSAAYTRRFFGENMEYGVTCQNMYWVYRRLDRREEARDILETARKTYEKLLGSDHERTRAVSKELEGLQKEMES